jgi:predicted MFS family arabinose efflux permease
MIFTAISILFVGSWCDKKGWQQPFFYGLFLSCLGFLLAFITRSPLIFLFALACIGFGYGLSYISAQNFVTTNSPPEKKAQGLSEYYAGCVAGSICGIATGGMLAEQLGFSAVFLIGFLILSGVILCAFFFMKPFFSKPVQHAEALQTKKPSLLHFFLDSKIVLLLLLNIIPAAVVLVGFMNFFIPVYLHTYGISQSDIGRIFMIFGICLIYIAPFITKRINAMAHSLRYITLGGILGGFALLTFTFLSGYMAVAVSILFLGFGASFNALRNAYALNLTISKTLGEGRMASLIFFHARIGQALGPIVFAWFAVTEKGSSGIIYIGIIFLLLSLSFLLINKFTLGENSDYYPEST